MLTVGSLFSGIGGLEKGFEDTSFFSTLWQSETNPYAAAVLRKRFSGAVNLGDVRSIDWSRVERVDILCGGFPCQPVSTAGRRKAQADARWLWPEFFRAICDLRPRYVVVENVPGLLNANDGDAFAEVLGDLAAIGYDAEWESIPAAAVGAPHLRYRVFIVAYADGSGFGRPESENEVDRSVVQGGRDARDDPRAEGDALAHADARGHASGLRQAGESWVRTEDSGSESRSRGSGPEPRETAANSEESRIRRMAGVERTENANSRRRGTGPMAHSDSTGFSIFEGSAALAGLAGLRAVGRSSWWATEPDVGRVAHGIPSRVDRLRCLGNAVVPRVAEFVGRCVAAHTKNTGLI